MSTSADSFHQSNMQSRWFRNQANPEKSMSFWFWYSTSRWICYKRLAEKGLK